MRVPIRLLLGALVGVAAGCSKGSPATSAPVGGPPVAAADAPAEYTGPFAAGRKVYDANGCARCHSIGGESFAGGPPGPPPGGPPPGGPGGPPPGGPGGRMGGKGPDLSHVGGKESKDWLVAHVRNAKDHKPQSRMPPYDGKISDADLSALGDYLASLK